MKRTFAGAWMRNSSRTRRQSDERPGWIHQPVDSRSVAQACYRGKSWKGNGGHADTTEAAERALAWLHVTQKLRRKWLRPLAQTVF